MAKFIGKIRDLLFSTFADHLTSIEFGAFDLNQRQLYTCFKLSARMFGLFSAMSWQVFFFVSCTLYTCTLSLSLCHLLLHVPVFNSQPFSDSSLNLFSLGLPNTDTEISCNSSPFVQDQIVRMTARGRITTIWAWRLAVRRKLALDFVNFCWGPWNSTNCSI